MKKILLMLLALVMLVGAVACAKDDGVPEGYMSVSLADEIFTLYVPQSWQNNSASGLSGAYSSLGSGVSVNAYTVAGNKDLTLADYVAMSIESYQTSLKEFKQLTEPKATTLGGLAALTFDCTAKTGEAISQYRMTVVKEDKHNTFTTLTCAAPEAGFDQLAAEFEAIVSHFVFRETADGNGKPFVLVDENTPEGYQLASHGKYEFRLYVPKSWKVNTTGLVPTATVSESDTCNVTLNSMTSQSGTLTGEAYWESFKAQYGDSLTEVSVNKEAKLGEYNALAVEYITRVGTTEYYTKQVFLSTRSLIYVFTYTSDAAHYDTHMEDVNTIISMFEFK